MAGGEHETIAVGPRGVRGVVLQESVPQCEGHGGSTHRRAGVAALGLLDGVYGEESHGVDAELVDVRRGDFCGQDWASVHGGVAVGPRSILSQGIGEVAMRKADSA